MNDRSDNHVVEVSAVSECCTGGVWMMVAVVLFAAGCASTPENEKSKAEKAAEKKKTEAEKDGKETEEDAKPSDAPTDEPTVDVEAGKRVEEGVKAANEGNYERAKKILESIPEDDGRAHLGAYNLGVVAEMAGKNGEAAESYVRALEINPDFTPALMNLVRLYIRQGKVDEAGQLARKYTKKRSENLKHRAAELEVKIARGHYEEVIKQARSILRRDERNVEAMLAMAKANFWLERFELTKAVLERASELAPERADIFFLFGLVARENEQRGRAISNFRKAIEYNARFAEAYNNLGLLYHDAGDYAGAAAQFQEAIAHRPDYPAAMINLGNAYKGMGELEKAEKQFQKVLERDSDNPRAYFNLGVLYLDAKVPGMDKIPRLEKSIEMLNEYKRVSRGQLDQDDPTDNYISSAREKIKAEKQRQKMMRQSQKGGGSSDSNGGDGNGDGN